MVKVSEDVKDILKTLPDYWDDVRFIDGFPGRYVIIARRSGDRWIIAGINGEKNEKKVKFDLTSFKKSKATLFTDGTNGDLFSKTEMNTKEQKSCDLTLNENGGFVMVLE